MLNLRSRKANMRDWLKYCVITTLWFFIVACGGGGEVTRDDDGNNPVPPPLTPALSLALALSDSNGVETTSLSSQTPLTLTVTVTDSVGQAVSGRVVSFTVVPEGLAIFANDTGTALTDAQGQASIGILVGNVSGSGEIVASVDDVTAQIGFISAGDATAAGEFQITMMLEDSQGGQSDNLAIDNPLTVITTVTRRDGQPARGELVAFSLSTPDIAIFGNDTGTALTDAQGVARIALQVGENSGSGVVTAAIGDSSSQIGFNSAGRPIIEETFTLTLMLVNAADEADNMLSSENPLTALATLTNNRNEPVVGELLNFELLPSGLAVFSNDTGTALTNAQGEARINMLVGDDSGSGLVTVRFRGSEAQSGFNSAGRTAVTEQPAFLDLFTNRVQLSSSGSDTVEVFAFVKNERNVLLSQVPIQFSADADAAIRNIQPITDDTGRARAELQTGGNAANRIITVTASIPDFPALTRTVDISVVGTSITINGPDSVIINDSTALTLALLDSNNSGIPNQLVSLSAFNASGEDVSSATLPSLSVLTNAEGRGTISFVATVSGRYRIVAAALGASETYTLVVQEDDFSFVNPPDPDDINQAIPLNTDDTIRVRWLKEGRAFANGSVSAAISRGTITPITAMTDANGEVEFTVRSSNAGDADIVVRGVDSSNEEVSARLTLSFIATEASSIIVDATPDAVGPDGQTSTITALVRDPSGNRVRNKLVNFTVDDVANGSLTDAQARTDRRGIASSVFTSNAVTSTEAVVVRAVVADTPSVSGATTLTVGDRPFDVTIGTGNLIGSEDASSYTKEFSVFVADADGNPVRNANVTLSVVPLKASEGNTFFKGYWVWDDIARRYFSVFTPLFPEEDEEFRIGSHGCPNEDVNFNGILDAGEDTNGDGQLTPGITATISSSVTTDENGQALALLRYPRQFGNWVSVRVTARSESAGSESRDSMIFRLGVAAADLTTDGAPPPESPYGLLETCESIQ